MEVKQNLLHYKIYEQERATDWLVFIHGAGGSIVTWKYQVAAFKPYFNLLLLDLRDHGKSKNLEPAFDSYNFDIVCDDILMVIDHIGLEKAHFMSMSLGSVILQKIEEKRPQLVDKMIMAGGVFHATWKIKLFVHSAKFLSYFLPYKTMYNLFSFVVLPKKNHEYSRRMFRLQSQKLAPNEYLKWVGLYKDFFRLLKNFFNQELESLSLVVMGAEDHVFFRAAHRFTSMHPKASLVTFEKCGHICNIEKHEEFNRTALSFLLPDGYPSVAPSI